MRNKRYKLDIIPGVVLSLFSLAYLAMIPNIQIFQGLGAPPMNNHAIPYLWGSFLLFLSLWITARGFRKRKLYLAEGGKPEKINWKTAIGEKREVFASFAALGLYVGLMGFLGFVLATIPYVFVQILILTPREKWKKNYIPAAITAVIAGVLLYFIFKHQLNVLLPSGLFGLIGL